MAATGDAVSENVKTAIKVLVDLYHKNRGMTGKIPEGFDRMLDDDDPGYYG